VLKNNYYFGLPKQVAKSLKINNLSAIGEKELIVDCTHLPGKLVAYPHQP
jgi:hypothetical protein